MNTDLLELLDFKDPLAGTRAIFLLGILDKVILKHSLVPFDMQVGGFGLEQLLGYQKNLLFRTERLNHLFKKLRTPRGVSEVKEKIWPWLRAWGWIASDGFRLRITAENDKSQLISTELLANLFAKHLPEIKGISIAPRIRPSVRSPEARDLHTVEFVGSVSNLRMVLDHLYQQARQSEKDTGDNKLLVVGPQDASSNALSSFIAQKQKSPAVAAIFLQSHVETEGVTIRLLEAAMESAGLDFAAAVYAPDIINYIWLDRVPPLKSERHYRDLDMLLSAFPRNAEVPPLIAATNSFLDVIFDDPRKRVDAFFRDIGSFSRERVDAAYALVPTDHGDVVSQLKAIRTHGPIAEMLKKRYVQANVKENGQVTSLLRPSREYAVELFIDSAITGAVGAFSPISEKGIAFENGTESLDVVFTPLYFEGEQRVTQGEKQSLFLPKEGRSSSLLFYFKTPESLRDFRVRIVMLHRSSVLQTLILGMEPLAGDPEMGLPYRLVVENAIDISDAVARSDEASFDLTLVLNDSLAGTRGVTAIGRNSAFFAQPQGWEKFVEDMQNIISEFVVGEDFCLSLGEPLLNNFLRTLAMHGHEALEALRNQAPQLDFSDVHNLQVIEAVTGVFLPVEFFYDGPVPDDDAELCANAKSALENADIGGCCCDSRSSTVICPLSFWGMAKRIERRAHAGNERVEIAIPQEHKKIKSLAVALLGFSNRVFPRDSQTLEERLTLTTIDWHRIKTWDEWTVAVQQHSPDLLVLLPHTAPYPTERELPSLEIEGTYLASPRMNNVHVSCHAHKKPVVLLLGCETALPTSKQFLNFTTKFYAKGASLVIATLSSVLGRHVAKTAGDLLESLAHNCKQEDVTDFGLTFLKLKRELLASGNPMGLTLVAYGDTHWWIKA